MNRLVGALSAFCSVCFVLAGLWLGSANSPAFAASEAPHTGMQSWTFSGVFGHFDRAQLQRGYKVYQEVCSNCHGMRLLSFRNLGEAGGPEFSEAEVKAIAAGFQVVDGPNRDGEMFERDGKPSDRFVSPFKNDNEARSANNSALPPDLSVIGKARGLHREIPWYLAPFHWLQEIAAGYQEGGADYMFALLTGYAEAPSDFELAEGMEYNKVFPGHQIAMPSPLSDEAVEYTDGTPQTVTQYARDLSAFFMWAADTKLEQRKQLGFRVMIYLLILTVLLYLAKRKLWSRVKH